MYLTKNSSKFTTILPSRVRKAIPNITPPITPAKVAKVRALLFRHPVTFSLVNLAILLSGSYIQSLSIGGNSGGDT